MTGSTLIACIVTGTLKRQVVLGTDATVFTGVRVTPVQGNKYTGQGTDSYL